MKVLLIDDEEELREPLVFLLESKFNATVIEASSGNQGIRILNETPDIDVIISDYNMHDGNGGDVFKFLEQANKSTPFILCSSDHPSQHPEIKQERLTGHVLKPDIFNPLSDILSTLLAKNPQAKTEPRSNYCRIKTQSLQKMGALASDLYIKLSEDKYVKVAKHGDFFEMTDFDHFRKKGIDYLFLPKDSVDSFLNKIIHEIISIKHAYAQPKTETLAMSQHIQNIIHDLNQGLGFTPEMQTLTKANVDLALNVIQKTPKLCDLMKKITLKKDDYISEHSVVLATVSCGLALLMKWPSDSTLFKLTLAAFLHDISIKNAKVAEVEATSRAKLQAMSFDTSDIDNYMNHSAEAANLVKQFSNIPPDVDTIIAQHHELTDGTGFPNGLNHARIFPLACIFIIAHDIVNYAWKHDNKFDFANFINKHSADYDFGYFKKVALNIATSCMNAARE